MTNTKATAQIERLFQVDDRTNTKVIQKMAVEMQRLLQVNYRTNTNVTFNKLLQKNKGYLDNLPHNYKGYL